jgi:hypothetical protein
MSGYSPGPLQAEALLFGYETIQTVSHTLLATGLSHHPIDGTECARSYAKSEVYADEHMYE